MAHLCFCFEFVWQQKHLLCSFLVALNLTTHFLVAWSIDSITGRVTARDITWRTAHINGWMRRVVILVQPVGQLSPLLVSRSAILIQPPLCPPHSSSIARFAGVGLHHSQTAAETGTHLLLCMSKKSHQENNETILKHYLMPRSAVYALKHHSYLCCTEMIENIHFGENTTRSCISRNVIHL